MRGYMEEEKFPQCRVNLEKPPKERGDTLGTFSMGGPVASPQFITPRVREEQDQMVPAGVRNKATEGSMPHELSTRTSQNWPGHRDYADDVRSGEAHRVDYDRLLPDEPWYRGRASAHRPAGYIYEASRLDYRIQEYLFNEPRPYIPTFSGKHDEWEVFWLKLQLMARRYNWSDEKQREQLLFCLKDGALNFATTLGPEIRESVMMFYQGLRDRFSHRIPAETVRASLNNIKKSSKESIQEYASRVGAMMARTYPDIGLSDTFNQLTMHHLLQGLPDQTIANEVLTRKPRTLSDAVDMMTWHECCKETTRRKPGIRQLSSFDNVESFKLNDSYDLDVRRVNGMQFVTEERLIQFGRDLKATIEKLFKENKLDQTEQAEEPMQKRQGNRDIVCFYCNEPGHISRSCPLKLKLPAEKDTENEKGPSQKARAQTQ